MFSRLHKNIECAYNNLSMKHMMREVPVFTSGGRRYLGGHLFTFGRGGGNLFFDGLSGGTYFFTPLGGGAGFFRDMFLRKSV